MSTIGYQAENLMGGVKVITWANMAGGDVGKPIICAAYADKCVQISGSMGAGTVDIEGSNFTDPGSATWATLNDPQGNALSEIAVPTIEQILENSYTVRPKVNGTGGSITVTLVVSTPMSSSDHIDDNP